MTKAKPAKPAKSPTPVVYPSRPLTPAELVHVTSYEKVHNTAGIRAGNAAWSATNIPVSALRAFTGPVDLSAPHLLKEMGGYASVYVDQVEGGDPEVEPIVVVKDTANRVIAIWDGWHRTAAAIKYKLKHVPAYVGVVKGGARKPGGKPSGKPPEAGRYAPDYSRVFLELETEGVSVVTSADGSTAATIELTGDMFEGSWDVRIERRVNGSMRQVSTRTFKYTRSTVDYQRMEASEYLRNNLGDQSWTADQMRRRYTTIEIHSDGVTEEPPIQGGTLADMFPDGPDYAYEDVLDMVIGEEVYTGGGAAGMFRVIREPDAPSAGVSKSEVPSVRTEDKHALAVRLATRLARHEHAADSEVLFHIAEDASVEGDPATPDGAWVAANLYLGGYSVDTANVHSAMSLIDQDYVHYDEDVEPVRDESGADGVWFPCKLWVSTESDYWDRVSGGLGPNTGVSKLTVSASTKITAVRVTDNLNDGREVKYQRADGKGVTVFKDLLRRYGSKRLPYRDDEPRYYVTALNIDGDIVRDNGGINGRVRKFEPRTPKSGPGVSKMEVLHDWGPGQPKTFLNAKVSAVLKGRTATVAGREIPAPPGATRVAAYEPGEYTYALFMRDKHGEHGAVLAVIGGVDEDPTYFSFSGAAMAEMGLVGDAPFAQAFRLAGHVTEHLDTGGGLYQEQTDFL